MNTPLNINKESCSPVSSNCVIWQGPEIGCINLCKGDTVTEVVYELATQLCNVLDKLNPESYDLTCLLGPNECPPENVVDILQKLIEAVCALQNQTPQNGEDGNNGNYVTTTYEPSGGNCQNGGVRIDTYSGVTNTIIDTKYVCNGNDGDTPTPGAPGSPGVQGKAGAKGKDGNYTVVTEELAGVNCADGGIRIDLYNGQTNTLISSEYVCNGADGTNGSDGQDGDNGNYVVQTAEPAGINCECGGVKLEVKDGVTDAVLSTEYICEQCEYGAMRAQNISAPDALLSVTWDHGNSRVCANNTNATLVVMDEVYDDDNAYDPLTGVWTCPATGRYNISFFVHLTNETGPNGWYAGSAGLFVAGITTFTGCNFYVVNQTYTLGPLKHLDVEGSTLGMNITAGTQLCLRVVNMTGTDYATPINGDVYRMVFQRVG